MSPEKRPSVAFPPDARFSLVGGSSLRIAGLRMQDEGNYTCKEGLNRTDHQHRVQLRVANPPHSTPKCWAETSSGLTLQLFCSWPGGYPHPTLHWREEGRDLDNSSWVISSTSSSDTHVETLNSSRLSHRKVFKCVGSHVVEPEEPACTVEIKIPSLESEPPETCFVGDSVTLTCRVTESTPAARLTWLRGIAQPELEIQPGGRFLIAQEGNVSRLTIQNCSQGTDSGCYVCKAQNPVGLRELLVCLTVKQPVNIVGVVGAVVVLSLLAVLTVTGVILYYSPLLCLRGAAFRNQGSGDILVLVDSEDDDEEGNGEEEPMGSSAKREPMGLESHWARIQHTATQKTLLLGQIKLTVLNLFQLATAWLKVPANVALEDTEAQLDAVSAALCPGGRMGTAMSLDGHGTRLPSPQVLFCMQDLAAVCTELRPGDPAPETKAGTPAGTCPRTLTPRGSGKGS
nr:PREDICTED: V-set and immunoglobulin domain-containing protein 10 [Opisthocomus hoazin]